MCPALHLEIFDGGREDQVSQYERTLAETAGQGGAKVQIALKAHHTWTQLHGPVLQVKGTVAQGDPALRVDGVDRQAGAADRYRSLISVLGVASLDGKFRDDGTSEGNVQRRVFDADILPLQVAELQRPIAPGVAPKFHAADFGPRQGGIQPQLLGMEF